MRIDSWNLKLLLSLRFVTYFGFLALQICTLFGFLGSSVSWLFFCLPIFSRLTRLVICTGRCHAGSYCFSWSSAIGKTSKNIMYERFEAWIAMNGTIPCWFIERGVNGSWRCGCISQLGVPGLQFINRVKQPVHSLVEFRFIQFVDVRCQRWNVFNWLNEFLIATQIIWIALACRDKNCSSENQWTA